MVRRLLSVLPGVGAALLPTVTCPACWPAYAGVLSALGLGAVMNGPYYFAVIAGLLTLSLFALAYRARSRRGYIPFLCGGLATALILGNKYWSGPALFNFGGAGLLIMSSVWNNWPRNRKPPGWAENSSVACDCGRPDRNLPKQ